MSTPNIQENTPKRKKTSAIVIAMISMLSLIIVIVVALVFGASQAFFAEFSLIVAILGVFFGYLQNVPNEVKESMIEILTSKRLWRMLIIFSFSMNIVQASIILWPDISPKIFDRNIQQTPTHTINSPAPSTSSTVTAVSPTPPNQVNPMALFNKVTSENPDIADPLNKQDIYNWDTYVDSTGSCIFKNGAFYASATPTNSTTCLETTVNYSNLALQANMTIIHQGDNGGIVFRSNSQENSFYSFDIIGNGSYVLYKASPTSTGQTYTLLEHGNNPAIKAGSNQSYQLTVITQGTAFYLYVNGNFISSFIDSSYTSGIVGVFTISNNTDLTQAQFTNLSVWKL